MTEGRVYTIGGQDWDEIVAAADEAGDRSGEERLIVNMGPQHPSTHGVLRLILTLDGETVTELRPVIGYLHTGIEKNMEFRTWMQGVTFCTRMDYLAPLFNEAAFCLGIGARGHSYALRSSGGGTVAPRYSTGMPPSG